MEKGPLVSVGIPCYNRPEGLRRTLECITGQSYSNLEIIVSDNCSPNPEVEAIGKEFARRDLRVQYYRQSVNQGPMLNFQFVLKKANGEYFMWAADDDIWESFFIENCLREFWITGNKFVAVIMEAQYFSEDIKFEFFEEGRPYYDFYSEDVKERLEFILKYNYGNLMYSLFRRDVLFEREYSVFEIDNLKSLNEIPLFLIVMKHGNWRVIPQIGFLKKTNARTYEQAKWEMKGGKLPNSSGFSYYIGLPSIMKYHLLVLKEIGTVIDFLRVNKYSSHLKKVARKSLSKHFYSFLIRYKPPLFKE